jgi:hypothetical protein
MPVVAELNKQLGSVAHTEFYMTLTPQCLSVSTAVPCTPNLVGETCVLNSDFPSFTPEGYNVISSLGSLITDKIDPKFPNRAGDILEIMNFECAVLQALAIESMLPAEDIKIYCSPCACAIRTALRISKDRSTLLIKYTVRVDERLPSSCCSYSTLVDTISSLLHIIQLAESSQLGRIVNVIDRSLLTHLDRQWIEKMLYRLECKPPNYRSQLGLQRRVGQLVSEAAAEHPKAVFIGEIDYLRPLLEMSVFPRLPRPPRVNELYQIKKSSAADPWKVKYLGGFTPKNYTALRAHDLINVPLFGDKSSGGYSRTEVTDLGVL